MRLRYISSLLFRDAFFESLFHQPFPISDYEEEILKVKRRETGGRNQYIASWLPKFFITRRWIRVGRGVQAFHLEHGLHRIGDWTGTHLPNVPFYREGIRKMLLDCPAADGVYALALSLV